MIPDRAPHLPRKPSMTRTLLLLGLVGAILLPLLSCGPSGTSTTPGNRLKIGVSIPAATHGWTGGLGWWAETAMKEHPEVDWVYLRAASAEQREQGGSGREAGFWATDVSGATPQVSSGS